MVPFLYSQNWKSSSTLAAYCGIPEVQCKKKMALSMLKFHNSPTEEEGLEARRAMGLGSWTRSWDLGVEMEHVEGMEGGGRKPLVPCSPREGGGAVAHKCRWGLGSWANDLLQVALEHAHWGKP